MRKRIGIIGLGDIAQKVYLPILSKHEQVEIVGLMSRSETTVQRFSSLYRIENAFTELNDLFNQEPQAVFVHTPTETHAEIVKQCLQQGIDVYVDKPLSYEISESVDMVETAERYGRLLAVGFNRRFAPRYVEAKAWLEEAGGFNSCVVQKHRTKLQKHSSKHTLYDDLIHMLDLQVYLNNGIFDVETYKQKSDEQDRLLHASGVLSLGEASGFFSMDRNAGGDLEKLELHGNGRTIEVTNMEHAVLYDKIQGERVISFGSWDDILYRRGFVGVVEHFLQAIEDPSGCQIRADQVLSSHDLVEQLLLRVNG
ncbi:gfo/Idh/MocA family oxidoreductase [Paenibacillus psychroresistens]|uniref:Gfo/Idh/MocA family oxidoreductase n=1 Tax=Paenibacillus psychroresistens TaxID=1778678 RepID=A0A6B8RQI5_9BACL|nr:Gfo/Idh/MocA family oxidoreductase [Paenibacillus psychroresistens]QGQ98107.1 gfo/Idh/MocA family oxidoreductase [Paenibacillus psychroresistens]